MATLKSVLFCLSLVFSAYTYASSHMSKTEFYRLSNIKDALVEKDCERFGGYRFNGSLPTLALSLEKDGERVRGYGNVISYKNSVYVFWSYSSGLAERTLEVCIFK